MRNDDFSTTYYLIKRATSKQNRKNVLKILGLALSMVITSWVMMYAFMYLMIFLYEL